MGAKDVFINLVGGLRIEDPAVDLAIICSIASGVVDKPINESTILCGEVGLAGEIRSINRLEHRLNEAAALGFQKAIIPSSGIKENKNETNLEIHRAKSVKDAFRALIN